MPDVETRPKRPFPAIEVLAILVVLLVFGREAIPGLDNPVLQTWTTLMVSITVQALPFLVLGVVVSGLIAAFIPPKLVARLMPTNSRLAVPQASIAGVVLPGCECGSVPIAGRLTERGADPSAAFSFMLAAPAINPVVLVATAVAFPGRPDVVLARFFASLLTAMVVGWIWQSKGDSPDIDSCEHHHEGNKWQIFVGTIIGDFVQAGGWLVVGAVTAATLQVLVPRSVLDVVAANPVTAILAMAVLAVLLAICSEADAFVATGLTQFSLTARLVFLVVGPAVDVKLVAMQAGVFGRKFAFRFAPLTFVVAVVNATLVGLLMAFFSGQPGWLGVM